jgi:hypothetical protein
VIRNALLERAVLPGVVVASLLTAISAQAVVITNNGSTIFDSGSFEGDTVNQLPNTATVGT